MPLTDPPGTAARVAAGLLPLGAAAVTVLRPGGFGARDALALAREARRGPVLLTLDLTRPLRPEGGGLAALRARTRPTLRQVLDALAWAAADDRVVGLLARVGGAPGSLATVQELADAVRGFAATGRPCVAHAEAFGEAGNGTLPYLLATAFGEVHLQPSGDLALLGVAGEVTFLRGALDKAGLDPQLEHRHEYKNASDVVTRDTFSPAHREALDALVDDWADQVVTAIADARGLDARTVRDAVDHAPLLATEARDRGLVDRLAYLDEALADVRGRVGADADLQPLAAYHGMATAHQRWRSRHAPRVALVDATGPITVRGGGGPLSGPGVSSDGLCADLRSAAADEEIAAVVLRVDSPGGSAVASDAIRREVIRTRQAGTPVVAWMGDVAGSGGYYIAMAADAVIAQPGTLTGSIGVIGGKTVSSGLEDKLGLHTDAVTRGAHARFYSGSTAFSDGERERLAAQLDFIYDDFTTKAAHDRGLPVDRLRDVARGRVWTGAQAHERGLVDHLGGVGAVLAAVRRALGAPAGAPLRVRRHPPPPSLVDRLRGRTHRDPAQEEIAALLAALPVDPAAVVDAVRAAGAVHGALSMPWVPRLR
jgi:protease-4